MAAIAREEGHYTSGQFTQWFIEEQIEEVATSSARISVAARAGTLPRPRSLAGRFDELTDLDELLVFTTGLGGDLLVDEREFVL